MSQEPVQAVGQISLRLREWIHEVNNSLFITKGFLEEIESDTRSKAYLKPHFDHENFREMVDTVARSVERLDRSVQKLRKYAREEVFSETGVKPTVCRPEVKTV